MDYKAEERSINILDLLWEICLKWRWILLAGLLGAMLAGAYSGVTNAIAGTADDRSEGKAAGSMALDDEQLAYAEQYRAYETLYRAQVAYNAQSPLMQLDPNSFCVGQILYALQLPQDATEQESAELLAFYRSQLRTDAFVRELAQLTGASEKEMPFLLELVDLKNTYAAPGITAVSGQNDGDGSVPVLKVSVYAAEEQACRDLSDLVCQTLEAQAQAASEKIGKHKLAFLLQDCLKTGNTDLAAYQRKNLDALTSVRNTYIQLKGSLPNAAKDYVDAQSSLKDAPEDVDVKESPAQIVNMRYVLVGFAAGAALVVLAALLTYLGDDRLRAVDDVEKQFKIKLLGRVNTGAMQPRRRVLGAVDEALRRARQRGLPAFPYEQALSMAAAGVRVTSRQQAVGSIYATGARPLEEAFTADLRQQLQPGGPALTGGKPILYNAQALEDSAATGAVILVERVGETLYSELSKEIQTCRYQNIKILGLILLQ